MGEVYRGCVAGVLGEVHTETPGLYQVKNWSYGQKIKKRRVHGGKRGG